MGENVRGVRSVVPAQSRYSGRPVCRWGIERTPVLRFATLSLLALSDGHGLTKPHATETPEIIRVIVADAHVLCTLWTTMEHTVFRGKEESGTARMSVRACEGAGERVGNRGTWYLRHAESG